MASSDLSKRVVDVMTEDDLKQVLGWAEKELWSPGLQDFKPYLVADRDGFFVAKQENGEAVAAISAVRSGESFGFVGLYICVPECRGRGHGTALFLHALKHLKGRVMGLEAVVAQQENYAKHGFIVEHDTTRFAGEVEMDSTISSPATDTAPRDDGLVIQAVGNDVESLIVDFDGRHAPAPRPEFVRAWLTTSGHVARAAIKDGVVEGYGLVRPTSDGVRIGPLFASSREVAELLMQALLAARVISPTAKSKVIIDVPGPNSEGIMLAERLGLKNVMTMRRMYKGPAPKLPLDRIFGVFTVELG